MLYRILLVCVVVISFVSSQIPYNRIIPRQNVCRVQTESFTSWQDFSYVTPGAPSYDDGAIRQTIRSIDNSTIVYQAQVYDSSATDHSAWGLLDFTQTALGKFNTPAYIDFYFLRQGLTVPEGGFASIATFSPEGGTPTRYVSVDVNTQGMIFLNNVPAQNEITWLFQKTNNIQADNKWMNITVYVDFKPSGGLMAVWQDGVIQSVANVTGSSSATLGQMHLGLVASGSMSSGSVYNYGLNIMEVCTQTKAPITTAPAAPTQPSQSQSPGDQSTTTSSAPSTTPSVDQPSATIPIPSETTRSPESQRSNSSKSTLSFWVLLLVIVQIFVQML